jgi:hypothetical protein
VIGDDFAQLIAAFANRSALPDLELASALEAPFVSRQLNSVERFIIAHEFGHVLAGDTARGTRMLNVPAVRGGWRSVAADGRDWVQEFTADLTGMQLGALARTEDESGLPVPAPPPSEAIAAYAPILFFAIIDSLEDAVFCEGSGEGSLGALPQDVVTRLIELARTARDTKSAPRDENDDMQSLGCRLQDHPPAWLRGALLMPAVDRRFFNLQQEPTDDVVLAQALVANAQALGDLVRARVRESLTVSASQSAAN